MKEDWYLLPQDRANNKEKEEMPYWCNGSTFISKQKAVVRIPAVAVPATAGLLMSDCKKPKEIDGG